jgi:soluble lytic murein transglycosylase
MLFRYARSTRSRYNVPMRRLLLSGSVGVALALGSVGPSAQQPVASASASGPVGPVGPIALSLPLVSLTPTDHPLVPGDALQLWMMPSKAHTTRTAALNALASAVKLEGEGSSAKALPLINQATLGDHALGGYAQYYKGLVELSLGRAADARRTFQALTAKPPVGFLSEAAALREAESAEGLGDYAAALAIYERLSQIKTTAPDDVMMRVGRAAEAAGDRDKALRAYSLVYYEFPFSDLAPAAELALKTFPERPGIAAGTFRYKLELGRAEQLFAGKRYTAARAAFEAVRSASEGDDRELVNLRLAESDYYLKRLRLARDGVKPYIERAKRQGEALFFYAVSLYDLGDRSEYFRVVRRLADEFPTQTWAEEALNHLATHYILDDEDGKADETFREMFDKYPTGRYAERAAWKIGWYAYRNAQYADTIRVFERGATNFPRSDYRPSWLYWSARAYDALNQKAAAEARYMLTATDYYNSYYGRLALTRLDAPAARRRLTAEAAAVRAAAQSTDPSEEGDAIDPLPLNQEVIRALLGLGLYEQAADELRYAQRVWGDTPAIQATIAWTNQKRGRAEKGGSPQFALYRSAINTMKRAYPQYLAVEGEQLPDELRRIIFPLDYWDLIRKYSAANKLDAYLMAALVAQESTFVRDIRSSARAVGLMQLMPATARQMARKLKLRYSASLLTNPEANIRMGTAYFAQNMQEFGDVHLVLASYNAGESAVRRWIAERPGLPRDEFIDDIPYPETQNYVKRILGTAEDYRRLYGGDRAAD